MSCPHGTKAQKNKATSYHLGQLKAKLAKLRRDLISTPSSSGGGGSGVGFDVARTGVASVGFVGFPSVGKVRNKIRKAFDTENWILSAFLFLVYINVKVNWHTLRSLSNRLHNTHYGSGNLESARCTHPLYSVDIMTVYVVYFYFSRHVIWHLLLLGC